MKSLYIYLDETFIGTVMTEIVRRMRKAQKISQTVLSQASNVGLRFVDRANRKYGC